MRGRVAASRTDTLKTFCGIEAGVRAPNDFPDTTPAEQAGPLRSPRERKPELEKQRFRVAPEWLYVAATIGAIALLLAIVRDWGE